MVRKITRIFRTILLKKGKLEVQKINKYVGLFWTFINYLLRLVTEDSFSKRKWFSL